jgi:hypothetical protein
MNGRGQIIELHRETTVQKVEYTVVGIRHAEHVAPCRTDNLTAICEPIV